MTDPEAFDAAVAERAALHLAGSRLASRVRGLVQSGATDAQIGAAVRALVAGEPAGVDEVQAARADERQRCVNVCLNEATMMELRVNTLGEVAAGYRANEAQFCADAIRALPPAP